MVIRRKKLLELGVLKDAIRLVYPGGNIRLVAHGRIAIDDHGSLSRQEAEQWLWDRNCRIEHDPKTNVLQVVRVLGEIGP